MPNSNRTIKLTINLENFDIKSKDNEELSKIKKNMYKFIQGSNRKLEINFIPRIVKYKKIELNNKNIEKLKENIIENEITKKDIIISKIIKTDNQKLALMACPLCMTTTFLIGSIDLLACLSYIINYYK
jgi:hypothetical protein